MPLFVGNLEGEESLSIEEGEGTFYGKNWEPYCPKSLLGYLLICVCNVESGRKWPLCDTIQSSVNYLICVMMWSNRN
jgi:hypothetical protein